jgi:hypothetical protein
MSYLEERFQQVINAIESAKSIEEVNEILLDNCRCFSLGDWNPIRHVAYLKKQELMEVNK